MRVYMSKNSGSCHYCIHRDFNVPEVIQMGTSKRNLDMHVVLFTIDGRPTRRYLYPCETSRKRDCVACSDLHRLCRGKAGGYLHCKAGVQSW
jgi:hypothetical protein